MNEYTYALSRFDKKPPLPKFPQGFWLGLGAWSPTWLSNSRSAPDWQRFTNLCQSGGLRPGHGGPESGPLCVAYALVAALLEGFSTFRQGELVGGGAVSEVGSHVTCGRPTPPVSSRPASGT